MVSEIHCGHAWSLLIREARVGLGAREGGGGEATDIGEKYYLLSVAKWEIRRVRASALPGGLKENMRAGERPHLPKRKKILIRFNIGFVPSACYCRALWLRSRWLGGLRGRGCSP